MKTRIKSELGDSCVWQGREHISFGKSSLSKENRIKTLAWLWQELHFEKECKVRSSVQIKILLYQFKAFISLIVILRGKEEVHIRRNFPPTGDYWKLVYASQPVEASADLRFFLLHPESLEGIQWNLCLLVKSYASWNWKSGKWLYSGHLASWTQLVGLEGFLVNAFTLVKQRN